MVRTFAYFFSFCSNVDHQFINIYCVLATGLGHIVNTEVNKETLINSGGPLENVDYCHE